MLCRALCSVLRHRVGLWADDASDLLGWMVRGGSGWVSPVEDVNAGALYEFFVQVQELDRGISAASEPRESAPLLRSAQFMPPIVVDAGWLAGILSDPDAYEMCLVRRGAQCDQGPCGVVRERGSVSGHETVGAQLPKRR